MKHRQMNILTGRETTHRERSTNILTSIRQPQRHDSDRLDTKGANINRQEQRPINKKLRKQTINLIIIILLKKYINSNVTGIVNCT